MADAGARRHGLEIVEALRAPLEEVVALDVALVFELDVLLERLGVPNSSTITEWSMTRWTGTSGLIFAVSPPSLAIASRIAARSTTQGTPVKSCISTRAGRYWISRSELRSFCQSASAWMSSTVTVLPSSKRSRFSSSTFIENGRRDDVAELLGRLVERVIGVGLAADVERGAGAERVLADGGHWSPPLLPLAMREDLSSALARWGRRGKGGAAAPFTARQERSGSAEISIRDRD